jgi:hypothetical protein
MKHENLISDRAKDVMIVCGIIGHVAAIVSYYVGIIPQ